MCRVFSLAEVTNIYMVRLITTSFEDGVVTVVDIKSALPSLTPHSAAHSSRLPFRECELPSGYFSNISADNRRIFI